MTTDSPRKSMLCGIRVADSGLTVVVNPDGALYRPKHGEVLEEAIAAGIERLKFRRKVKRTMRFDLETHDADAGVRVTSTQQEDQPVNEATYAARR